MLADDIEEIASVCKCGRKTVVNARMNAAGQVIVEGPQVEIGGNDKYESLCWTCWREALQENGVEDIRSLIGPSV